MKPTSLWFEPGILPEAFDVVFREDTIISVFAPALTLYIMVEISGYTDDH